MVQKENKVKRRNVYAMALFSPLYRKKVVKSVKKYNRKKIKKFEKSC